MRAVMTVKRFAAALALASLLLTAWAGAAWAMIDIVVLEESGILVGVDESEGERLTITMEIDGDTASGPLQADCVFQDGGGAELSLEEFVTRYAGKLIRALCVESTGEVVACLGAE